jgi:transcriptional regulator with XRE-family HTH domain
MEGKQTYPNNLLLYRRRMGFSQKHVAKLLGKTAAMLSRYERGKAVPSLLVTMGLGIVYRVPVESIYGSVYDSMREEIRGVEERLKVPTQPALF